MSSLQSVRGTHDLLPEENRRIRRIADTGRAIAARYGFEEISTPIFEFTEVFRRTLGEVSDIVTKEMYTFEDKGGDEITLRPEGTAGVARALISGGLSQNLPLKFFYEGPMFRYERPQKGRLRQFHQIGVELLGVRQPLGDIEVIAMGAEILADLGVLGQTVLQINTLGNTESRGRYRTTLVEYLENYRDELSEDSHLRLDRNPLRILDSKNKGDRRIIADAPDFSDHLDAESTDFFGEVLAGLDRLGIAYVRNPRLVRGLDYYCHTAFEFTTEALGAQGTVMAGGRYDGLVEIMGGPDTPGVGWAAGLDRLAMMVDAPLLPRPIAVVPVGEAAAGKALEITQELRRAGFTTELGYSSNLRHCLKRANKLNARAAVILGEEELSRDSAILRDLDSGDQAEVTLAALADELERYR